MIAIIAKWAAVQLKFVHPLLATFNRTETSITVLQAKTCKLAVETNVWQGLAPNFIFCFVKGYC